MPISCTQSLVQFLNQVFQLIWFQISFPKFKVSYVAAGFFRASLSLRGPNQETTREWLKNAWYFYTKLKNNFPQQETGIVDVSKNIHITYNFEKKIY